MRACLYALGKSLPKEEGGVRRLKNALFALLDRCPCELTVTIRVPVNGYPAGTRMIVNRHRNGIGTSLQIRRRQLVLGVAPDGNHVALIQEDLT